MTMSLSADEVSRYSRQMLLPEVGKSGQLALKSTSVLIVGCGGLGCPASLYLTAAGIGKIGLVDNDLVEKSNLHRQVLHNEQRITKPKTDSAFETLKALNSNVVFETINCRLIRDNASEIVSKYDIIIDGTDNPMTRYLLSDVCVINKKPLVSGSALRFDGQLTVYNFDSNTPCYRCLFPSPPPVGTVTNCSDGGVLGVIPGTIGNLQALETIKIALGRKPTYAGKMLLFDGLNGEFRTITLRGKRSDCISCGPNATIGPELVDYETFCGIQCNASQYLKILESEERMTAKEYFDNYFNTNEKHLLIDVRDKLQADITKLDNAVNIPLKDIQNGNGFQQIEDLIDQQMDKTNVKLIIMCRRGNASQKAVRLLKTKINDILIKDIIGGLEAWAKEVDPKFPMY
ncbi:adenylyltransferase and sulfurtransferase MOCS3-like [Oppia nitens]|uniref:adenylyltransferase and sulfurtransferase MOCS3-like n=1 Tax=Oppia nitens TaxID=1686743 RepID=UPI0023DC82E5|nr:adenylyltransferase and sulfurtransferase MOCS3-like [Oppia nitens]